MIQNKLFKECLDAIPADRMAEFELNFSIAERIAEILKQKGMTQRDLAKRLGKRESEISKWLTGRHNFTTSTLAKISYTLDSQIIAVIGKQYEMGNESCMMAAEQETKYTTNNVK